MSARIMAVDIGFRVTGVTIYDRDGGEWRNIHAGVISTRESAEEKRSRLYQAHKDVRAACKIARELQDLIRDWSVLALLVELPSAGAQGARANRCMGIATGVIASVVALERLPVEWLTPTDTRRAACPGQGKVTKDMVVKAMAEEWPGLVGHFDDKPAIEAVADAMATFRAAQAGNLLKVIGA